MSEAEDKVMNAGDKMREVNALLKMTAKKKNCKVSDLQWKRDRFGAIHIRLRNQEKKDAVST